MYSVAHASGWTLACAKEPASSRTSSAFATYCFKKAGGPNRICITNESRVRTITKSPGHSAFGRFCNFCIPLRPAQYNPRSNCSSARGSHARQPVAHDSLHQFLRKGTGVYPRVQTYGLPRSVADDRETASRRLAVRMYRRGIRHAGRIAVRELDLRRELHGPV